MPTYTYPLINRGADVIIARVIRIAEKLDADRQPEHASRVRQAIIAHRDELQVIAREIADMAEREIKDAELSSRVRPDTGGAGGPSMGDYIGKSDPLARSLGSVGMNDEEYLDAKGVGWWATNEEGYSGHIGRTFIGAFEGTRPDPARFREHALLRMGKSAGGNRGLGTIRQPIPERRFVQDGGSVAERAWHSRVRASRERMIGRIEAAVVAARLEADQRRRVALRRRR